MNRIFHLIDPGRLAVVLMDMQNRFLDNGDKWALIQSQVAVIGYCRSNGIPVIVVEYEGFGETNWRLVEALGSGWERFRIVRSSSNDAFVNSGLGKLLESLGVTTILFMGINACSCVYQTALGAVARGYDILTCLGLIAENCDRREHFLRRNHLSRERECPNCALRTGWYAKRPAEADGRRSAFGNSCGKGVDPAGLSDHRGRTGEWPESTVESQTTIGRKGC